MKEDMPEVQKQAVLSLCNYLKVIYPDIKIKGHRELYNTDCPRVKFPLQEIKEKVRQTKVSEKLGIDILEPQKFLNSQNIRDYENKMLDEDGKVGRRTRSAFEKLKECEI